MKTLDRVCILHFVLTVLLVTAGLTGCTATNGAAPQASVPVQSGSSSPAAPSAPRAATAGSRTWTWGEVGKFSSGIEVKVESLGLRPIAANYYGPEGVDSIATFRMTVTNGSSEAIPSGSFGGLVVSYGAPSITTSYAGDDEAPQATLLATILPGGSAETLVTYGIPSSATRVTVEVPSLDYREPSMLFQGPIAPV